MSALISIKGLVVKAYQSLESSILGIISDSPLLLKFFSKEISIRLVVFAFIAVIAFISFNSAYLITSYLYKKQIYEAAFSMSLSQSKSIKAYLMDLMHRGVSKKEIREFISQKLSAIDSGIPFTVEIMPTQWETLNQDKSIDPETLRALQAGVKGSVIKGNIIREFYPLKAEARCMACHREARPNELLGVLTLSFDLNPIVSVAERKIAIWFFLLLPIPLSLIIASLLLLNSKLSLALNNFKAKIDNINSVKDLTALQIDSKDIGFHELTAIAEELNRFSKRIKSVAVDREILEFEIRILEKFIITSEVVKDWKEHVSNLLVEINKVLTAHTLFSIFQIDEEVYDLEIFWYNNPSEETKERLEKVVKEKVRARQQIFRSANIKISHNIVHPDHQAVAIDEREIEFQTKSLILDSPQIGGVVGIGVHAETSKDAIQSLVIDGVLTTLINVVGSIKAIYKYTRDLEYYATRDPLTNLYNQRIFWELLGYEISRAERHKYKFSLLVIDLDNFKNINDSYGHAFGDKYLRSAADAIHNALRQGDILGRYGGDEYAVVLPEADEEQGFTVAMRIRDSIDRLTLDAPDGGKVKVTASIGLAVFPTHASQANDLFLFADSMMYRAKQQGKNTVLAPTADDVIEVFKKTSEMTLMVIKAIEEKMVIPFFQPIADLSTGQIDSYEVLSRIRYGEEMFNASDFIDIAEKTGMVTQLDHNLMERVFQILAETTYSGKIFVNLSPKSLIMKEFIAVVVRFASQYAIGHNRIVFEIKEKDITKNLSLLEKFVAELYMQGFRFGIDDFGGSYSTFRYLVSIFPIDFIKIDKSFIMGLASEDNKDLAFVRSMASLCSDLGIKTIAKSVEDEGILQKAKVAGVNYGQGFYVGPPTGHLTAPK